ncbi:ABC transporter permease [Arthrobacter bambusae]|uniref:Peptide/nickel transport system permease protein n=1 Tax=Arthrobacter bambusae TaxID=1338426 RepID=A0AAW8DNI1_9MICC|nr:ABC transporter permease [Arthrobacter bambusae]MDP9907897.1 peptide/nickel transport system permease protein [Arthrobacter bambusae]MDQ0132092.1 peptide/nickel transport system permease protein [Arthrobacter bambusae]MDQ0183430.1 peptide/nickel transport system permease protein [Arthrobacter bambusae]
MNVIARVTRSYVTRRVMFAVLVLWAVFTAVFIILFIVPGDPAQVIAGGAGGLEATDEQLAAIRAQYGLDQPVIVQYFSMLWGAVTLDWGTSFVFKQPVLPLLAANFASTAQLAAFALIVAVLLGLLIGGLAAYTQSRLLSSTLDALPPIGVATPTFWVGLVLMQVFSFTLGWFPASGDQGLASVVLPGLTMAIPAAAIIAQVFAKSLRTASNEPFVPVARAKGLSRLRVFLSHTARNALLPTVTVMGLVIGSLFAASTVSETIFSRNGLGMALQHSVQSKDIPMVLGAVMLVAGVYVITTLVVDLLYPLIDPRLRSQTARISAANGPSEQSAIEERVSA